MLRGPAFQPKSFLTSGNQKKRRLISGYQTENAHEKGRPRAGRPKMVELSTNAYAPVPQVTKKISVLTDLSGFRYVVAAST